MAHYIANGSHGLYNLYSHKISHAIMDALSHGTAQTITLWTMCIMGLGDTTICNIHTSHMIIVQSWYKLKNDREKYWWSKDQVSVEAVGLYNRKKFRSSVGRAK